MMGYFVLMAVAMAVLTDMQQMRSRAIWHLDCTNCTAVGLSVGL